MEAVLLGTPGLAGYRSTSRRRVMEVFRRFDRLDVVRFHQAGVLVWSQEGWRSLETIGA
jgi:hypothetical protein